MKRRFTVGIVVLAGAALLAPLASARAAKLSFYQVAGPTQFYGAAGNPISVNPPATLPAAGDSFDETDTDYAGSFKHHAKQWSATDHLTCAFTNSDTGMCDFQLAVSGSLLLFNHFTVHFQDNSMVVGVSEGTGSFRRVRGSLTITDLPNGNSNLVVRVS